MSEPDPGLLLRSAARGGMVTHRSRLDLSVPAVLEDEPARLFRYASGDRDAVRCR